MTLIDTPDQTAFAESVAAMLATEAPMTAVRRIMEEGEDHDEKLWRRLADLGVTGLLVPEDQGGAGADLADLAPVLRELARRLVPSPVVPTAVLAVRTLLALGDAAIAARVLPGIAAGTTVVALAVSEVGSDRWIPRRPTARATRTQDGWSLDGTKLAVVCASAADLLLVHAADDEQGRAGFFLVEAGAAGLEIMPDEGIDPLRRTCTVTFAATPAEAIAGDAEQAASQLTDVAHVVMAIGQAAAALRAIELTAEYAGQRYSFGQPIGSYQGVKHRLADLYTSWSLADAATRRAVESTDAGERGATACASAARLLASRTFVDSARQMMLFHGGMGFTWEHDAHLFYKRAMGDAAHFGTAAQARHRLAVSLGLGPSSSSPREVVS